MSSTVDLTAETHPNKWGKAQYQSLIGIDDQKNALVTVLTSILDPERLTKWLKKHHAEGLTFLSDVPQSAPLVLLSGDVGCGKTALAHCVASPVAEELNVRIVVLETPSNIRGIGLVGDLSGRIAEAFTQAKTKAAKAPVILIIDESDDLATSREQNQAHHEDRAGVNVLLKQIDLVGREKLRMAVIMITNRAAALDPAVQRRAALSLEFRRPNAASRLDVFKWILAGTNPKPAELDELVALTESAIPYTYSDLTDRIGRLAVTIASKTDVPFSAAIVKQAIRQVPPSPQFLAT